MKVNLRRIKKHRKFSEEFKRGLVREFESGKFSVVELSRLHQISSTSLYKWIYKFSTFNTKGYRVVEMKDSSDKKVKQLHARIKELEAMLGRKQIRIDYLEKMIELAKEELEIDIKKNFDTPPSGGSEPTVKK